MAISDQLTELAARAKNAEEHAAAAQGKAKADVQADVEKARSICSGPGCEAARVG